MLPLLENFRRLLTKAQPFLLWLICAYFSYSFILNGFRKFDPEGFWAPAFGRWGYPVWFMFFIGLLETLGGLFILIPRLRYIGGIILGMVMLGAFITRAMHGMSFDDGSYIFFAMVSMFYMASNLNSKKNKY